MRYSKVILMNIHFRLILSKQNYIICWTHLSPYDFELVYDLIGNLLYHMFELRMYLQSKSTNELCPLSMPKIQILMNINNKSPFTQNNQNKQTQLLHT